ncbi:MAG: tRNA lysidine(34) synthetase TilS [Bdellovibrionaceae bacterium]|nr:tRNA lysidine(34) synthetase TilS [Pseudobdellovibrionaceae bacterium]
MKSHFFNKSLKLFKEYKIQNKKIIIGVSGGLDSIVLLDLLKELSSPCQLKLYIIYIHHGDSHQNKIKNYRDKAKKLVLSVSQKKELEFLSPKTENQLLKSEEEFRKLRHTQFKKALKSKQADIISLAHNQQDLLETRLIQLIRGCGLQGLESMSYYDNLYLRPLIFFTRKQIYDYALKEKLKWLEDPSNKDNKFLRNWIRNKWLKDLENKRLGAVKTLSRSLEVLIPQKYNLDMEIYINSKGIKRKFLIELSLKDQKRVLAFYMRKFFLRGYGHSHITEILKHNERAKKTFSIELLKKTWIFTKDYIKIR